MIYFIIICFIIIYFIIIIIIFLCPYTIIHTTVYSTYNTIHAIPYHTIL